MQLAQLGDVPIFMFSDTLEDPSSSPPHNCCIKRLPQPNFTDQQRNQRYSLHSHLRVPPRAIDTAAHTPALSPTEPTPTPSPSRPLTKQDMVFRRKKEAPAPPPPPQPAQSSAQRARDLTRQNDRTIQRAQRELGYESLRLEQEERKITAEIKSLVRKGRVQEARMLAKNLVQLRNAKSRNFQAGVQAGAIGRQAHMAQTDAKMVEIMSKTAGVMQSANGLANPEQQMAMLQQYDMESEKYKLNQEMTDEVLDSVLGGTEIDDASDDVLNSVLDEIGLEVSSKMGGTPQLQPQALQDQERLQMADDDALRNRIDKLGGGV